MSLTQTGTFFSWPYIQSGRHGQTCRSRPGATHCPVTHSCQEGSRGWFAGLTEGVLTLLGAVPLTVFTALQSHSCYPRLVDEEPEALELDCSVPLLASSAGPPHTEVTSLGGVNK